MSGGTSGMGLAVARMVLEAGGSVVLTGNKKDKAEAVQKELSPLGPVAVIAANLMTEEGMETIRHEINASHRDISLMVNAAGIFMPKGFTEHSFADYDMYFSLNRATFFITQDVVKNMLAAKLEGSIVNVGSIGAQAALGDSPSSAYSMAKAGLHALTRNLAIELASAGNSDAKRPCSQIAPSLRAVPDVQPYQIAWLLSPFLTSFSTKFAGFV